jgi:hypothetical protein
MKYSRFLDNNPWRFLNPKISIAIRNPLICVIIYLIERNRIFIWQNFSIEKSGLNLTGIL